MKNIRLLMLLCIILLDQFDMNPFLKTFISLCLLFLFLFDSKKYIEIFVLCLITLGNIQIFYNPSIIIFLLFYIEFFLLEVFCNCIEEEKITGVNFNVTILTLTFFFYFRVILERLPREIPQDLGLLWTIIGTLAILIHLFSIYRRDRQENTNKLILKLLQLMQNVITWYFGNLKEVYTALVFKYSIFSYFLQFCCEILIKYQLIYVHLILIFVQYFIYLLVSIAFLFDCYFHEFKYFYKTIIFLLLPLCITVLFFALEHFIDYNLLVLDKKIILKEWQLTRTKGKLLDLRGSFELTGETMPGEYGHTYIFCMQMTAIFNQITELQGFFSFWVYNIVSSLYILGWTFLLGFSFGYDILMFPIIKIKQSFSTYIIRFKKENNSTTFAGKLLDTLKKKSKNHPLIIQMDSNSTLATVRGHITSGEPKNIQIIC